MGIPHIAHRIWFGEPLPEQYYAYLRNLRELNPTYVIKLWFDPTIISSNSTEEIKLFCEKNSIELCNIRDFPDLLNYDLVLEELQASRINITHKKLHYVRASDIARVGILEKEGGIYTDTDTIMKMPLFDLTANHGFLLKALLHPTSLRYFNYFSVPATQAAYQYFFCNILYDFLAFTPHHVLLTTAAKITRLDYKTYHRSNYRGWERSNNAAILGYGTVRLTGTSIKYALNFLHQTGHLALSDPCEIFLAAPFLMDSTYDKSWLEGFGEFDPSKVNADVNENNELDAFLGEIHSQRLLNYPIKDYGEHPELADGPVVNRFPFRADFHVFDIEYDRLVNSIITGKGNRAYPSIDVPSITDIPPMVLPTIKMPEFTFPKNDFTFHLDAAALRPRILTRDIIYDAYNRNNGGLLAKFSIFALHLNSTPYELIKILQERSTKSSNPNSASRRTLEELGEYVPPLHNGIKYD